MRSATLLSTPPFLLKKEKGQLVVRPADSSSSSSEERQHVSFTRSTVCGWPRDGRWQLQTLTVSRRPTDCPASGRSSCC